MNVLHVIPGLTLERGGPSTVVSALCRFQAEAGHRVTVLTTDQGARNGEIPVDLHPSVRVERHRVVGPDRLAFAPQFVPRLRVLLRTSDLVHVHSIFTYPVHAALRQAKIAGVPVALRPCGQLHPYSLRRSRSIKSAYLALWGTSVRQACSAWHYTSEQESVESWPSDASPRFVLPNGIDESHFVMDREEAHGICNQSWHGFGDAPYVLFLGRLHPKKRLDLLLEAFIAGAPPSFKLVVAGPDECGSWKALTTRMLRTATDSGRVIRIDTVQGQQKVALLTGARLFALPSEHENFGIAALEALAAGTPVLLSPHVDLADDVLAAELGHTAPLTVEAWKDSLAFLLTRPVDFNKFGMLARTWVQEHYAWKRIAGELEKRYEWVRAGCPTEKVVPLPTR